MRIGSNANEAAKAMFTRDSAINHSTIKRLSPHQMYLLISSMQSLNHFWKKKPTLDKDILHNYRPVSNLPFVSKLVEKGVAKQISIGDRVLGKRVRSNGSKSV